MEKQRIQVYADIKTKRRIELAAAKYNVAVTEYCLSAIQKQLEDDDLLEEEVTIAVNPTLDESFILSLKTLQEKIKSRRAGRPIDIDTIMNEMRDERDHEILGLC